MTVSVKQTISVLESATVKLHRVRDIAARFGGDDDIHSAIVQIGSHRNQLERSISELPDRRISKAATALREAPAETLFHDTPAERERRVDRLIEHFRQAEVWWSINHEGKKGLPTPRDFLWLLICDAERTVRLLPDEVRKVSRVGTVLPAVRDTLQADQFRRNARLEAGMAEYDAAETREIASDSAADRMTDILDLFRFVTGGRAGADAARLKRCVRACAAGFPVEQCGRVYDKHRIGFDRRAMEDIKDRVLGQILAGIATEFNLVKTNHGFRRLTVREIEARRKVKKQLAEALAEIAAA